MPKWLCLLLVLLVLNSCVEYSPYTVSKTKSDINQTNIDKIVKLPSSDTINIIATGDCQRFYKETEKFVNKANTLNDVDFVVVAGDISDFGVEFEHEYMLQVLEKLNFPFVSVVGNHDLVFNGSEVFKQVYGPLDFSFDFRGVRFIGLNTNGREYNFDGTIPNLNWLDNELKSLDSDQGFVLLSHVATKTPDFDPALRDPYLEMLERDSNCIVMIDGHEHAPFIYEYLEEGRDLKSISTASPQRGSFFKVKLWNKGFTYEIIEF